MPVDGGAGDAELFGDLLDGVAAFAVVVAFVVHLSGELHLPGAELGFLAAGATAGAGGSRPSRARSNSAMVPRIGKNMRPTAVEVSRANARRRHPSCGDER